MTGMDAEISFEARAYQACISGLKRQWSGPLYRQVVDLAGTNCDAKGIEQNLRKDSRYQVFGWLEHYLQQFKYLGRWGMLTEFTPQEEKLAKLLADAAAIEPDRLDLDPDMALPDYFCVGDFHQHPGGIWSDAHDAFAYEWGATLTTPMSADHGDLHDRFAGLVNEMAAPENILDQACGFGKTTLALKSLLPDARVTGSDVAGPCLMLGHKRAVEAGLDIRFVQCPVEDLRFDDSSFDAVTGSMLLHEMPPSAIRASLIEARRVLKPGGLYAQLDFYDVPGGEVGRFFHNGHSARNREPYMMSLIKMDLAGELEAAGFEDVAIVPFEEGAGALDNGPDLPHQWRFPWTLITGRAKP